MKKILRALSVGIGLLALVNCGSRSFESQWRQALADHQAGKTTAITGPWEGSWLSEYNGHNGSLRCIVMPAGGRNDSGPHLFRYWATWAGPLQGGFNADFDVAKMGSQYHVEGDYELGNFGSFRHEGVIQGENFEANYRSSSGDHGTFNLKRPR